MTTFLNTTALSYHLELLIKEAEEFLFLVSPFVSINKRLKQLIEHKTNVVHPITIIYGKKKMFSEEYKWLESISNVNLYYCSNLHAKCYINENKIILGSMNLYRYSQENNYEMGVIISKDENRRLYMDIFEETKNIFMASTSKRVISQVDFDNLIETTLVMRDVFREIYENYNFNRTDWGGALLYTEISDFAMRNHSFRLGDLYRDGSAVLRSTEISRDLYNLIIEHFSKIGIKKQ